MLFLIFDDFIGLEFGDNYAMFLSESFTIGELSLKHGFSGCDGFSGFDR